VSAFTSPNAQHTTTAAYVFEKPTKAEKAGFIVYLVFTHTTGLNNGTAAPFKDGIEIGFKNACTKFPRIHRCCAGVEKYQISFHNEQVQFRFHCHLPKIAIFHLFF
jgi:hypothetical protein